MEGLDPTGHRVCSDTVWPLARGAVTTAWLRHEEGCKQETKRMRSAKKDPNSMSEAVKRLVGSMHRACVPGRAAACAGRERVGSTATRDPVALVCCEDAARRRVGLGSGHVTCSGTGGHCRNKHEPETNSVATQSLAVATPICLGYCSPHGREARNPVCADTRWCNPGSP